MIYQIMTGLDAVLTSFDEVILLVDSKMLFRNYWVSNEDITFASANDFLNKEVKQIFSGTFGNILTEKIAQVFETKTNVEVEYLSPSSNKWYRAKLRLINTHHDKEKQYVTLIISNCTEEMNMLAQKSIFESIISQNWDAIVFANTKGIIEYLNPAANLLYGYEGEELIGQSVDIFNSHESHDTSEIIQTILNTGMWAGEIRQIKKDKTVFDAYLSIQLLKDKNGNPIGYSSHSKSISAEKETAQKLKKIIAERETLLKEIHHRVKNNLQVITSLLSLQSSTIQDEATRNLFQQSQFRINAMATIHKTLYQSDDFLTIGYNEYIHALCHYLIMSMKGDDKNISLVIDAEDIKLNMDTAIPLGLLINEVITNSLKYGIIGNVKGKIEIRLKRLEYPKFQLFISDDGIGFDQDIHSKNIKSLGLNLIRNLARQLKGNIQKDNTKKGTFYIIDFEEIE